MFQIDKMGNTVKDFSSVTKDIQSGFNGICEIATNMP